MPSSVFKIVRLRRLVGLTVVLLTGCGTAVSAQAPAYQPPSPTATVRRPGGPAGPGVTPGPAATPGRAASPGPAGRRPAPRPPARITYPAAGRGRFAVAPAETAAPAGRAGRTLRYRIEVETDITGVTAGEFAAAATATLRDPHGWTADGEWRLRRVGRGDPADFTVRLVTPGTRDRLCHARDGYTSCRNGDEVVVNVARWVKGVPRYGASLAVYRQYLINHEVGHRLGQAHELCPRSGGPAPVMQQQTLGLHGCTANAWPFRNGKRLRGRVGAYRDDVPERDRGSS